MPVTAVLLLFVFSRVLFALLSGWWQGDPASAFCQWDCRWYIGIVRQGYFTPDEVLADGRSNWAYFPLYPLLAHGLSMLTGLSAFHSLWLVANAAALGALLLLLHYLRLTRSRVSPWLVAVLFCLGPYSFYLASGYSEALFALLLLGSALAWRRERHFTAGGLGLLLSATRIVGVAWGAGLLAQWLWQCRHQHRSIWRFPVLGALLLCPLGLVAYMLYLWGHVGDPLAFMHVQAAWGRTLQWPIETLASGVHFWLATPWQHSGEIALYEVLAGALGLGLALSLLLRGHIGEGMAAGVMLLIPMATGLESLPRYLVGIPFMLLAVHDGLMRLPGCYRWGAAGGLVALNLLLLLPGWTAGAGWLK
ncbi:mannosyltransferase PIG-V [Kushneria sinocarnis]|uniref:Mannosyltransferase PIG-V n=1 Tax=Kushneria sinocarnis TaxID=595502 RepID=A0A420WWW1_9GAMM|nr:mannosyltransferase family protein [Kushneria sinocarnis]RKR04242.1 mannosyltransferase PIG-V [Kushneria sinocarnis]